LANGEQDAFFLLKKVIAVSIILIFTLLHYTGVRWGGRIQNVLTAVKIMIVLGLAGIGIFFGQGNWEHFSADIAQSFSGSGFGTAMMLVMFSYSGWNASAYIAGEIKNPRRSLPISLFAGTTIVILIYLAVNIFIFQAAPYSKLQGEITVVETAAVQVFGDWIGSLFSLLVAVGLLSSLSAFIIVGPRVYYAMARDRLFFKFADKIHPRFDVPGRSILTQGGIAILMVLIGTFEQLVLYIIFALSIFPWMAIAGIFIARKKQVGEESAVRVFGYPFVPLFFLICSFFLIIIAYLSRPVESSAAILTVLVGIPVYFFWVRKMTYQR
ncbi:amino acid permease, partial [candidate division KSB1 bacterium]|nr:amino acid permease [candidate division KSB1 bacterium]